MNDTFWGLTSSEWTAIGTIALAAVGIISVIIGVFATRAARDSAKAAATAATAMRESVGAQTASVEAEFALDLRFNEVETPAAVRIYWKRPVAILHEVSLEFADLGDERRTVWGGSHVCKPAANTDTFPRRVFPGETLYFMWPDAVVVPRTVLFNEWNVVYSLSSDGERFTRKVNARNVSFA
jgi:hypothetical protein